MKRMFFVLMFWLASFGALANPFFEVDLLHQEWTADFFSATIFNIQIDPMSGELAKVQAKRTNWKSDKADELTYFRRALQFMAHHSGVDYLNAATSGSNNIYRVTKALDDLAHKALLDELSVNAPGLASEKLTKLDQLLRNLLEHDAFIHIINQNSLPSFVRVPTHSSVEKEIMTRRQELYRSGDAEVRPADSVEYWEETDLYLEKSRKSLFGARVTISALSALQDEFNRRISGLTLGEQSWMRRRFSQIFNPACLRTLLSDLRNEKSKLPEPAMVLLGRSGVSKVALEQQLPKLKKKLVQTLSAFENEASKKSTKEFLTSIGMGIVTVLSEDVRFPDVVSRKLLQLNELQRLNFKKIGNALFESAFRNSWPVLVMTARVGDFVLDKAIFSERNPVAQAQTIETFYRRQRSNFIDRFTADILDFGLKEGTKDRKLLSVLTKTDQVENLISAIDKCDDAYKWDLPKTALSEQLQDIRNKEEEFARRAWESLLIKKKNYDEYLTWERANEKFRLFAFSQSRFGSDQVLGQGVCKAISYRWQKALLTNPNGQIRSLEDLEADSDYVKGKVASAHDRFVQASYGVSWRLLREGESYLIPDSFLKKDGLKQEIVAKGLQSLDTLIESVTTTYHDRIARSHGVFGVSMKSQKGGHAVGIQIDTTNSRYRFWDPNAGMWEYPTLKQMRQAFSDFVDSLYGKGYFVSFGIVQIWS